MNAPVSPKLQAALDWAAHGFHVFPIALGTKTPLIEDWQHQASTDADQIYLWWGAMWPDANIGCVPDKCGCYVADLDCKGGRDGIAALKALEAQYGEIPDTLAVRTPNGGAHLWLRGRAPNSVSKIAPGIDIRGASGTGDATKYGYVLLPGSSINGKAYELEKDASIADAPAWLSELANEKKREPQSAPADIELDSPGNVARAIAFLEARAPATEGQNGDNWTYQTACHVRDLGVSEETALRLMGEYWNDRCVPPWRPDELADKVANAFAYSQNAPGCYAVPPAQEAFGKALDTLAKTPAWAECSESGYPEPLSGSELAAGHFPRAEFQIEKLFLKQHVNLLYGDGGVGKSTLALNAAVAIAAGKPFLGRETKQAPVLMVQAEDDYGETKYRLECTCEHYGCKLADLPIQIWCLPGHDVVLANVTDSGEITRKPFFSALEGKLRAMPGAFVVLDSLADIASLTESERLPVNAFLKRLLGGMCKAFDATILVLAHPSKASMSDGSHYSGTTAFNNAVRSRLTLKRPTSGSNRRVLEVPKLNYGPESELEIFLMGSVFLLAGDAGQAERNSAEREAVLAVVLKLIDRGVSIVRANGNGQKPVDIAKAVAEQHGIAFEPRRVLEILNAAERDGVLAYQEGGNGRRGQKAGFVRGGTR